MKKYLAILLLCSLSVSVYGDTVKNANAYADAVLKKVAQKIQSYKTVRIAFKLEMESYSNKIRINAVKQGTFQLKGLKYYINIKDQEVFCDGTDIWIYDKKTNEVQINKQEMNAHTITPQRIFTDFSFYEKDFVYKLNKDKYFNKKPYYELELVPIDKTKPFFKILLYVSKNNDIYKVIVKDKTASQYTYTIQRMVVNKDIKDATFIFNKSAYKNVEEIDLR